MAELDGDNNMEGTDVSEEEREETTEALCGYIFRRAEADTSLSRDQSASFQQARVLRSQESTSGMPLGV